MKELSQAKTQLEQAGYTVQIKNNTLKARKRGKILSFRSPINQKELSRHLTKKL